MIDEECLNEIRERTDIGALIAEHVPLSWVGDAVVVCPFHSHSAASPFRWPPEKTLRVVRDHGFFHCTECGASGDAITFLMRRKGLNFLGAVRELAARIPVSVRQGASDGAAYREKRLLDYLRYVERVLRREYPPYETDLVADDIAEFLEAVERDWSDQ